ncbi:MAG: MaoC family dehydratase [Pseudomonadota bacterium]
MPAPKGYSTATLVDHIGHEFGSTKPLQIDQSRINTFADVTGDHQWIHVEPETAKQRSPFGNTIAHGFLTLSLMAAGIADEELGIAPPDAQGVLNYGTNKVRFLTPVLTDSTVTTTYKLVHAEERGEGRVLVTFEATMSIEGVQKPAVVAELLAMVLA